jgi:ATP-dependent Clp protease protease subunit
MKIAKLNIEGYIGGADIVSLFSGEETFNLSKLKKFLDNIEADTTDIHVYINSGGGSVVEGWAIYDKLKTSGKTITTIGEGMVGSIATIIYMAGSTRKLHENSKFFIHNPYWQPSEASPMEGDALINLGEDLKKEQQKILDFYANQTGTPIESIQPLMQKATDLTSAEAVNMGFATEIISSSANFYKYQLVAMVEPKKVETIKQTKMENKKNDSWIARQLTKLAARLNGVTLNMEMPVKDTEGKEVTLFVESETEDLTGKSAYIVDTDGNQTAAPDGDYTDAEGRVIKVAGGVVTEVVAKAEQTDNAPTVEELNAKIAELEAKNTELEGIKANLSTELEAKTQEVEVMNEIKVEFENLKKVVIGKGVKFEDSKQDFNKDNSGKTNSYAEQMAARIKNKQ